MTDFLKPVVTTGDEFVIAVMTRTQADWLAKFLWRYPPGIHHDYLDQLAGIFDLKEFGDRLQEPPKLIVPTPLCGTRNIEVIEIEGDPTCPCCGTAWWWGEADGATGDLCLDADGPKVAAELAEIRRQLSCGDLAPEATKRRLMNLEIAAWRLASEVDDLKYRDCPDN